MRFVAWTTDEVTRAASTKTWGGRRDLNPRLSEPQSDALPAELLPPQSSKFTLVCVSGKAASRPNAVAGKGAQQCCAPTESSQEYRCFGSKRRICEGADDVGTDLVADAIVLFGALLIAIWGSGSFKAVAGELRSRRAPRA